MGCDIHMYVEKINPNTKRWEKVGKKFFNYYLAGTMATDLMDVFGITKDESWDILFKWKKGEKPTNKTEEYIINKYIPKKMDTSDRHWYEVQGTGKFPYPYTDSPYDGRCYSLFGILAGVRDTSNPMIGDWNRYLPDDVSDEVREISDEWDIDGHSHNHLYLRELLESDYMKMSKEELRGLGLDSYFFHTTIPQLQEIGDPDDIRIVFWFDN